MKTEKNIIVIVTKWTEEANCNFSEGTNIECACNTMEESVEIIKEKKQDITAQISLVDCESLGIEFKQELLTFNEECSDKKVYPSIEADYLDEDAGVRFTYRTEAVPTDLKTKKK